MMEVMDESDLERELEEADKVNTSTSFCSRCQLSMDKMCAGTRVEDPLESCGAWPWHRCRRAFCGESIVLQHSLQADHLLII